MPVNARVCICDSVSIARNKNQFSLKKKLSINENAYVHVFDCPTNYLTPKPANLFR